MSCFIPTDVKYDEQDAHSSLVLDSNSCNDKYKIDSSNIYSDCDLSQNYQVGITSFEKPSRLDNPNEKRYLKNGGIYGINTIKDTIISIEGVIASETCEGMKSAENFLNKVWKLGVMRTFKNRGFFKLQWKECGEDYWCYAQLYRSLPQVEVEDDTCFRKNFKIQLVVKDAKIFKGLDLIKLDPVTETWGCKNPNCCIDESDLNNSCQNNFLNTAKLTIRYTADSDLLLAPHINPLTNLPYYTEPVILTDFILVRNVTTDQNFRVSVNMRKTDVLVINGLEGAVYLNGVELVNAIDPFLSEYPSVTGQDEWVLMDATFPGTHGEQLEMDIEYYQIA